MSSGCLPSGRPTGGILNQFIPHRNTQYIQQPEPELPSPPSLQLTQTQSSIRTQPSRSGKRAVFADERNEEAQIDAEFSDDDYHESDSLGGQMSIDEDEEENSSDNESFETEMRRLRAGQIQEGPGVDTQASQLGFHRNWLASQEMSSSRGFEHFPIPKNLY